MHIKICYADMDKSHLTRYQDLHNFKYARKGVIQDYPENIKVFISSLQNKSNGSLIFGINGSAQK